MIKKRLAALALAGLVAAGITAPAYADELPYLRTFDDGGNYMGNSITPESYPQPCLTSSYLSSILSGYADSKVVTFAPPANAFPRYFEEDECGYLDSAQSIQYAYGLFSDTSFEIFLNECSNEENILYDGSEGYAAYVEPGDSGRSEGHILFGMDDYEKGTKLYARIFCDASMSDSESSRVEKVSALIAQEIDRITETVNIELLDVPMWTTDYYAGIKCPSTEIQNQLLVVDFPEHDDSYQIIISDADDYGVSGLFYYSEDGGSIEFKVKPDSSSPYAQYKGEEDPDHFFTETIQGYEVEVYMDDTDTEYASRLEAAIPTGATENYAYYLDLSFYDTREAHWTTREEAVAFLSEFIAGISLTEAESDPYIPAETEEVSADEAGETAAVEAAEEESWICPECETENNGNFCSNCGTARP